MKILNMALVLGDFWQFMCDYKENCIKFCQILAI